MRDPPHPHPPSAPSISVIVTAFVVVIAATVAVVLIVATIVIVLVVVNVVVFNSDVVTNRSSCFFLATRRGGRTVFLADATILNQPLDPPVSPVAGPWRHLPGDGGWERTPLSKARWGGICRTVVWFRPSSLPTLRTPPWPRPPMSLPSSYSRPRRVSSTLACTSRPQSLSSSVLSSSLTSRDGSCRPPCPSSHLRLHQISPPPPTTSLVVDCNILML